MLIQLIPNQISDLWGQLKPMMEASLPPTEKPSDELMNNLLESAIKGTLKLWAIKGDDSKIYGIVSTTFIDEVMTGTRTLLIYTLFGFTLVSEEIWKASYATLRQYAKSNKCQGIIGYTDNNRVEVIAKALGARVTKVVRLEV